MFENIGFEKVSPKLAGSQPHHDCSETKHKPDAHHGMQTQRNETVIPWKCYCHHIENAIITLWKCHFHHSECRLTADLNTLSSGGYSTSRSGYRHVRHIMQYTLLNLVVVTVTGKPVLPVRQETSTKGVFDIAVALAMGILIAITLGVYYQGHNTNSQRSNCDSGNSSNSKKKWLPRTRTPHAKQDYAYVVGCQGSKMEGDSKHGSKCSQRTVRDVHFNKPEVAPHQKSIHAAACAEKNAIGTAQKVGPTCEKATNRKKNYTTG